MTAADELRQQIEAVEFQIKEAQRNLKHAQGNATFYQQQISKLTTQLQQLRGNVRVESTSDSRTLLNG